MNLIELETILLEYPQPSECFEKIRKSGGLKKFFPELFALIGVPQNEVYHKEGDVWTHTMLVLDEASEH